MTTKLSVHKVKPNLIGSNYKIGGVLWFKFTINRLIVVGVAPKESYCTSFGGIIFSSSGMIVSTTLATEKNRKVLEPMKLSPS